MIWTLCSRCKAKGLTECEQHIPQALLDAMMRPTPYVFLFRDPGREAKRDYLHTSHAQMLSEYEYLRIPKRSE